MTKMSETINSPHLVTQYSTTLLEDSFFRTGSLWWICFWVSPLWWNYNDEILFQVDSGTWEDHVVDANSHEKVFLYSISFIQRAPVESL